MSAVLNSHNTQTPSLILCRPLLAAVTALTHQGTDKEPLAVSRGAWHISRVFPELFLSSVYSVQRPQLSTNALEGCAWSAKIFRWEVPNKQVWLPAHYVWVQALGNRWGSVRRREVERLSRPQLRTKVLISSLMRTLIRVLHSVSPF